LVQRSSAKWKRGVLISNVFLCQLYCNSYRSEPLCSELQEYSNIHCKSCISKQSVGLYLNVYTCFK